MIRRPSFKTVLLSCTACVTLAAGSARADLIPSDLIISASTFVPNTGEAAGLTAGQPITVDGTPEPASPPGGPTAIAVATDANLGVFTNSSADSNFGITAPLTLLSVNPTTGTVDQSLTLPTSQIVTSFSSKSEGSLSLSQDGHSLNIVGYHVTTDAYTPSPVGALDVSNASTTAFVDTGLAAGNSARTDNRTVATIGYNGTTTTTDLNAYSGNNGRAVQQYNGIFYTVGNANLGNTGVEELVPGTPAGSTPNSAQVGQFNTTQVGNKADKVIKDNNFRGETIYNNTLYVTKGSGSNGIDTVYQVGAAGALANGANLPTGPGTPITVLPGFPTAPAKTTADYTPFGLFFANPTTLYVSDEGTGDAADNGVGSHAGLEKWSLINGTWKLDYTLQAGLIGTAQSYNAPGFDGTVTEGGLRDIYGQVNADGTVTIYGITATTDNIPNMDNGADPNEVVDITDTIGATTLPTSESFNVLEGPILGTVYRGVSDAPIPEPASIGILMSAMAGIRLLRRRRAA
jgi:hypothetical protein